MNAFFRIAAGITRVLDGLLHIGSRRARPPATAKPRKATLLMFEPVCQQDALRVAETLSRNRRAS